MREGWLGVVAGEGVVPKVLTVGGADAARGGVCVWGVWSSLVAVAPSK